MKARPTILELFREVKYPIELFNKQGKPIYYENDSGDWYKYEYDTQGNETYYEDRGGDWEKTEYNDQGKPIYGVMGNNHTANLYWWLKKYDAQGNETYWENSYTSWAKSEYNKKGECTYYEDSYGEKSGTPKTPVLF